MEHVHVRSVACAIVVVHVATCGSAACYHSDAITGVRMCVRSLCMCVEQRAVISRIVAYVCMELSMCVASSHMCVCV